VWLSFGRVMEHVVLSPAQHQVHHSLDPRHHDKNFGEGFSLWDWLCGTLYVTSPQREVHGFGVAPELLNHRSHVFSMLVDPVIASVTNAAGLVRRRTVKSGPDVFRRPPVELIHQGDIDSVKNGGRAGRVDEQPAQQGPVKTEQRHASADFVTDALTG
jgi:hypothetical protein